MKRIRERDRGWKRIKRDYKSISESFIKVGIQAGETDSNGLTIAQYAAYNEFGTKFIPERPFLRSASDENRDKWTEALLLAYSKILDGKVRPEKALGAVGTLAQKDIQKKIVDGPFQENSPKTIAKKGSSRPLIDEGFLRGAIRWILGGLKS
jgi:hypothetical protein